MSDLPQEKRIIQSTPGYEGKGMRLDHWLTSRFTYRSRTEWQKAIRDSQILLNGKKTRPSRILHGDEIIDFDFGNIEEPPVRTDYSILYENPHFIAVAKPGNIPVHPAGRFFNHTLLMLLRKNYGELYVVNRLDRETSGIVLFARSSEAAAALSGCLARREAFKKYIVLVHGDFPQTLDGTGWLSPDTASTIRKKRRFTVEKPDLLSDDVEDCKTVFNLLEKCGPLSKVECILHTGRLHQIRATLCSLGFPVAGDKLYGVDDTIFSRYADGIMTAQDRENLLYERQALHAWKLEFISPFNGEKVCFEAPFPDEFQLPIS